MTLKYNRFKSVTAWVILLACELVLGCATTKQSSGPEPNLSRREKVFLEVTTRYSKPDVNLNRSKLGILPLKCNKPELGVIISDTLEIHLRDSSLKIVERSYLSRQLKKKGVTTNGLIEDIDYAEIAKACDVDYLLTGTVATIEREYTSAYVSRKVAYTEVMGVTAHIVKTTTGEVAMSVVYNVPREVKWYEPSIIAEVLATAIKYELWKQNLPYDVRQ